MTEYHKGKYKLKNPTKYVGDRNNIIYRSSYELRAMNWFDLNEDIKQWSSEPFAIPYVSPVDNRVHRYFPDFIIQIKQKDGPVATVLIEIKPHYQTQQPTTGKKKKRKTYIQEVKTWAINNKKWEAAEKFCQDKGWKFQIITEKELHVVK